MNIFKTLALSALALAIPAFTACNSDDDEPKGGGYDGVIFGDFVTLTSVDNQGAIMSLIPLGGTKTVTLSTDYKFNLTQFKADTRIFLNYYYVSEVEDNTVSGPVHVVTALNVDGAGAPAPTATAEETNDWASHRINMSYLQLSGNYVNFIYTGQSVGDPKSRHFYLDPATEASAYPEFHIMFEGNLSSGDPQAYGVRGSYSIADIRKLPAAKGIKVIYPTGNTLESTTLDFDKLNITPAN